MPDLQGYMRVFRPRLSIFQRGNDRRKPVKTPHAQAAKLAGAAGDRYAEDVLAAASAHWLRHSLISTVANHVGDLKTAQDQGGHENIATTSVYLHRPDEERHEAVLRALAASKKQGR